ncbi:MAG: tetratricopeptide repeat protein [Burkholderiales bacterium]|nr:tetratricopeptide repeat protein [Burkholderiales bacterium]
MHSFIRRTALGLSLILAAAVVHADELQDITRMMRQGQLPQSLERVEKYLAGKPRDAQGRFLKGLILTEMNRASEAIQVFSKLSEDYPELPEPYNNLAVLYASQGQYEKARVALESSIRTHPSYATAHENLGDIYAKLASQAYDKALQLDSSNTGAKTKLAMIGELIGGGTRAARAPARAEPVKTGEAAPAKAAQSKVAEPAAAESKAGQAQAAQPMALVEPKAVESKAAEPKAAEAANKAGGSGAETDELVKTVRAWASAWAGKDVAGYLAHYAKDFKTPKGESRSDWEKLRTQRISAPKKIEVGVESPKVSISGDNTASVTFRQIYSSDIVKATGTKTLVMVKSNGKWLIREERVN